MWPTGVILEGPALGTHRSGGILPHPRPWCPLQWLGLKVKRMSVVRAAKGHQPQPYVLPLWHLHACPLEFTFSWEGSLAESGVFSKNDI